MRTYFPLFIVLFIMSSSSLSSENPPTSSSSSVEDPQWDYVEFRDPTETFQIPPPTKIPLGELIAECDFVAVVHWAATFNTEPCVCKVLRVKRMFAVKDEWEVRGPPKPRILRDSHGCEYLIAVSRHSADIFTHDEDFDHDAYNGPGLISHIPYLYFGKVRPVTDEQATLIENACPDSDYEAGESHTWEFEVSKSTPVRAVQGLRGVYPLFNFNRAVEVASELGSEDAVALMQNFDFKYLIQTYGEPDATLLVEAVNRLFDALSKETQGAREALGALSENIDPVVSSAANHLLQLESLPRFVFEHPVPLPVGN